ncbi:hypothetical protein C0995_004715 [Termitomyces sp. Mi166|nr:hypothetical protein C0995_004715 [Termitomyces sp. Mi166\
MYNDFNDGSRAKSQPPSILVNIFVAGTSADGRHRGPSIAPQKVEKAILNYAASAQVALEVLTEIASIHPIIAAPVMAFKLVVTLDLKRRENDAKVLVVKLQIQNMMAVLAQLANVKSPHQVGPDGLTLPGRLRPLMQEIREAIEKCSSDCDMYRNKTPLRRFFKSAAYEGLLAEHGARFSEYEAKIQRALTIHTTFAIESLHDKFEEQKTTLQEMRNELRELFIRLDTPREKEIRDTIDSCGGPKACINDNKVLQILLDKSGEDIAVLGGRPDTNMSLARQSLLKELAENVDEALRQNFALFQGKLEIQKQELDTIIRQGDRIMAFLSGYERICDRQIRNIWEDMGWKNTVKARHFVLALRDFYLYSHSRTRQTPLSSPAAVPPSPVDLPHTEPRSDTSEIHTKDKWARSYINISYLQAISESIDDDGSGLITIQEVNNFTEMRPKGWSLLQWMAYWAVGWQSSISIYHTKIYRLLRKIYKLRDRILPDNRQALDAHLSRGAMYNVELLLHSTKTLSQETMIPQELERLRDQFGAEEEERIRERLEKIAYTIDSPATMSLVTGPGRIERLARTHILHVNEFWKAGESLLNVFLTFSARLHDLSAIFQQMHVDVERQFENFAFGMFKKSYGTQTRVISQNNLVSVWKSLPTEPGEDDDVSTCPENIPIDILKFGVQRRPDCSEQSPLICDKPVDYEPGVLQGPWAGYCTEEVDGDVNWRGGLIHIDFVESATEDRAISGKGTGASVMGPTEIAAGGRFFTDSAIDIFLTIEDGRWFRCRGTLDQSSAIITGNWSSSKYWGESKPPLGSDMSISDGTFWSFRTPGHLVRFRYQKDDFEKNRSQARWTFACTAVLYEVRRQRFSKEFVMTRLRKGRRFRQLATKLTLESGDCTRRSPFTAGEQQELRALKKTICPTDNHFYFAIAQYISERIPFHILICVYSVVQDCELAWMIPKARSMSERIKTAFREQNTMEETRRNTYEELAEDSFVCDDCNNMYDDDRNREHRLPLPPEKLVTKPASATHAMLYIKDDSAVEILDYDQLARVEKRLTRVKANVEDRLDKLEKQVADRTSTLEDILNRHFIGPKDERQEGQFIPVADKTHIGVIEEHMERRFESFEARLTTMEQMLKDLLSKVSGLNTLQL